MGVVEVVREAYPDHTAQDPENNHFDPRATPEKPIWEMVDVRLHKALPALSRKELAGHAALAGMELMRRGSRLSVCLLYTSYQAECSQGTLQAIFEYQTAVSRLLDMDCANASVYDGGTALFEACMMAVRTTRRKKLVVDQCINPAWRAMLETYSSSLDVSLVTVPHKDGLSEMCIRDRSRRPPVQCVPRMGQSQR